LLETVQCSVQFISANLATVWKPANSDIKATDVDKSESTVSQKYLTLVQKVDRFFGGTQCMWF